MICEREGFSSKKGKPAQPIRHLQKLLPEAFWDHLEAAWREELLSYCSLFGALAPRRQKKVPTKATRIEVE